MEVHQAYNKTCYWKRDQYIAPQRPLIKVYIMSDTFVVPASDVTEKELTSLEKEHGGVDNVAYWTATKFERRLGYSYTPQHDA